MLSCGLTTSWAARAERRSRSQAVGHGGEQGHAVEAGQAQVADAGVQFLGKAPLLGRGHRKLPVAGSGTVIVIPIRIVRIAVVPVEAFEAQVGEGDKDGVEPGRCRDSHAFRGP